MKLLFLQLIVLPILLTVLSSATTIPTHLQLVHPDVHLNPYSIFSDPLVWKARLGQTIAGQVSDLRSFIVWALSKLPAQVGKDKVEALIDLNTDFKDYLVKNQTTLPSDYLFFGPDSLQHIDATTLEDTKAVVGLLFKTNAFYTTALTADATGKLFIKSYDGDGYFQRVNRAISADLYKFVDAELTHDFEFVSFEVYNVVNGQKVYVNATELEAYEVLIVLLNYYSECLHTNLHTFQYLMGSALAHAADINVASNAFATPYMFNLATTYQAVVDLDLREGGVLVGGIFQANRTEILDILRDILQEWGHFKTAQQFVNDFLFAGFPDKDLPVQLGLLTQFIKHTDVIHRYAEEVSSYITSDSRYQANRLNYRIRTYLIGIGTNLSKISKLNEWLELMSVIGLMHGQTLSFTRLMVTKVAFTAISPSDTFTTFDLMYWRATAPTIIGAQPGRALFTSTIWSTESAFYDPSLVNVIAKYTSEANALKQAYYDEVNASTEAGWISKYGWIVSDFFPDGFDGRQLTVTTYL